MPLGIHAVKCEGIDRIMPCESLPQQDESEKNPYSQLIIDCKNDASLIQRTYENHREQRNTEQKTRILSPQFVALDIDPILFKIVNRHDFPTYQDPRHCLVFWSRPTSAIRNLARMVQLKLLEAAPSLWLMPAENLHMTTLEIAHSLSELEISARLARLQPKLDEITDFTFSHRTKLIRPMVSFDAAAVALSFVPAATASAAGSDGAYTYHHLRRDLYDLCQTTGVVVHSRYVMPSAHLTLGRFVTDRDFSAGTDNAGELNSHLLRRWTTNIEAINQWLKETYWSDQPREVPCEGDWVVGKEKGLDCRVGTLWYGEGNTVRLGKGF